MTSAHTLTTATGRYSGLFIALIVLNDSLLVLLIFLQPSFSVAVLPSHTPLSFVYSIRLSDVCIQNMTFSAVGRKLYAALGPFRW